MLTIDLSQIQHAAELLRAGKLVALPTETVYGLGADARNQDAITKIFLAKERPFSHPLIVHLHNTQQLSAWARDIPPETYRLAEAFWPGPLTLILKKQPAVNALLTGGQDSVGLRIPAHPAAQALLQAFGSGIAAPSANRFSRLSPTTAAAVHEELGSKVDCILEGGGCAVGIESTILDLSRGHAVILRPGMISATQIAAVIQQTVSLSVENAPRVPGMAAVHYAPETPLILIDSPELSPFLKSLGPTELPLACLVHQAPLASQEGINWIVMAADPQQYAHDLYITLRALDKQQFKRIAVEAVPTDPTWDAIRDRLQKAARRRQC